MGKQSRRSAHDRMVSASDLAQMGRCEKLVVFEHLYGSRRTPLQQQARARGLVEHAQFYREGRAASTQANRKGRCFVATYVFGETWQTEELRRFRDEVLRPSAWGRRLRLYYRGVPGICVVLHRWPPLQIPVRMLLGVIATGLRWLSGLRGGGKCRR